MKKEMFNPARLYTAVVTPFREDLSIDFEALGNHLDFLSSFGITALFLGGTTGEFDTLTHEEKRELLVFSRQRFTGIIVFNVSSCSLKESLEFVRYAENFGADAVTALPPYYRAEVGAEGLISFFNSVADSTDLPLILYNFTRHTQNEITSEMLAKISCCAVKDSDKNYSLIQNSPVYLCGGDSIIAEALSRGAGGVVSVQANYRPLQITALFESARSGDASAGMLQKQAAVTAGLFRKNKQIGRIKRALSFIIPGYPSYVRLPLVGLTPEEDLEIASWYREAGHE